MKTNTLACAAISISLLQACSGSEAVDPERYVVPDRIVATIANNVDSAASLNLVADIDHSRLGHDAGSPMPPSRVLIFSDKQFETDLIGQYPLAALELPLRVLTYESGDEQSTRVIYNSFDYLASRYALEGDSVEVFRTGYNNAISAALAGVAQDTMASFEDNQMQPDGIITLTSPYDFEETISRVKAAIESQDDTMYFGTVDFQANAQSLGIDIRPSYMILFGGPGPGGKAMANAPTLGLDGFCQKFLIWQDESGNVHLSFNDLLALARRQSVSIPAVLRVVDFRLNKTFKKALAPE